MNISTASTNCCTLVTTRRRVRATKFLARPHLVSRVCGCRLHRRCVILAVEILAAKLSTRALISAWTIKRIHTHTHRRGRPAIHTFRVQGHVHIHSARTPTAQSARTRHTTCTHHSRQMCQVLVLRLRILRVHLRLIYSRLRAFCPTRLCRHACTYASYRWHPGGASAAVHTASSTHGIHTTPVIYGIQPMRA